MKKDVDRGRIMRLLHPRHVVLVTSEDPKTREPNIVTLAWSTPLSFDPPLVGISVSPRRYSHDLIASSREFVINVPTVEIAEKVLYCGRRSGRSHDKFGETGLTAAPSKNVRAPIIRECVAHIECRVVDQVETGDHTFFVGEVEAAYVDETGFTDAMDVGRIRTLHHLGGNLFVTTSPQVFRPKLPETS